jgi:putative oxidoreductase
MSDSSNRAVSDSSKRRREDIGKLVLRVAVGVPMLFHGVHKVLHGIGGVKSIMTDKGLPSFVAYGVYVGEVIAPILIVAGLFSRPAAIIFAFNMLVAIMTAHSAEIVKIGRHGEWSIELPMLYLLGAVSVALLGPGRFSVSAFVTEKQKQKHKNES